MRCSAREVAEFLGGRLRGANIGILRPRSLDGIEPGAIVFANTATPARIETLNSEPMALGLVGEGFEGVLRSPHIVVGNARLAFARVLGKFFPPPEVDGVSNSAVIHPTARVASSVSIGEHAIIGAGVSIGEGTIVRHHVVVAEGVQIGARCLLKSSSVIGEEGFGFETGEAGEPVRVPHLGSVVIGDDVEIGAGTVIARGTLDATMIGDRVKIDDLVFIAHNVIVGEDTLVIANAEVSGSVHIAKGCWVGPGACIINAVTIGEGALIGMGAVVTKDVEAGVVVAGSPARVLRKRHSN